ncbi:vancomycin resistance protein VanW [Desulfohalotomaculum tongense]|uniref:VanW family protein n=1 Tax=Desulforadius tongensis TaxID=1216062 RepID=UPI00195D13E6|nr:VanW family protein [Desulforadius tongensis]MBM7855587.1 vancomycin resistance protein VanW [Desulforadius tongensis]
MSKPFPRPKHRSKTRLLVGRAYFSLRRYISWYLSKTKYAQTIENSPLPYVIFKHQTPLIRRLQNVDMYLQYNKIKNLKLATARINGLIIKPGETFSFWKLIGKPTRKKGYVEGMVLHNGSFKPGTGGGLCQLSNLIYWMALHSPLTVTERWRHSYDVFPDCNRTQPFGSGATVAYNYIDLQIRNDTKTSYQLIVYVGDSHLHGQWRCKYPCDVKYRVYEVNHHITHEWWGGYMRHNVLRRKLLDVNGNEISDQLVTENHAIMMYDPLLSSSPIIPLAAAQQR